MDKNKLIGLGLIGVLLMAIGIMNKRNFEENQEKAQKIEEINKTSATTSNEVKAKDAEKTIHQTVTKKPAFKEEIIQLETDKTIYQFSTKGGILSSVALKGFETFDEYQKGDNKGDNSENKSLKLFDQGDNKNELIFDLNGKKYYTGGRAFEVVEKTDKKLVLQNTIQENQYIQFIYTVKDGVYDMDFDIRMKGFESAVAPNSVMLKWGTDFLSTERLLRNERMISTTVFQFNDGKHDWLTESRDNSNSELKKDINWVAHKQSYFSSIMKPASSFSKENSKFSISTFKEGTEKESTHIKHYTSTMNLGITNTADAMVHINWFFGPNQLDLLKSYKSDYDDILNLGWGLFRWINIYVFHPLFTTLATTGINYGLVILLMTLVIKLILTPIQWKMFVSSIKMRILKPEIEELNAKYPNKEDAMKKQTEMMTLYKESGASPLAGCLPALIQAPILFAVFRYFPASFELRQKAFLWAEDLSSYDSIVNFSFDIPLYGNHISLFTLLMAATTMVYTIYNSSNMTQPQQPGMPNMKIIMYLMPIMMIFFFNNYSSALSYYYFISTLFSIIIMLIIKQFFVDEEKLKEKMMLRKAEVKAKGGSKKSKFQERLEAMQKMQQEQMERNKKK